MFSRLYLGVHSPADIVAGGIIGCVILAYWIKIDTILDRYISFGDSGMCVQFFYVLNYSAFFFAYNNTKVYNCLVIRYFKVRVISVG